MITNTNQMTLKERLFMGISWMGKATVQAALAPAFLAAIKPFSSHSNYSQYESYGTSIQTTAIFAILLCASTGSILLNSLGTSLLSKSGENDIEAQTQPPRCGEANRQKVIEVLVIVPDVDKANDEKGGSALFTNVDTINMQSKSQLQTMA